MNARGSHPETPLDLLWQQPPSILWTMLVGEGLAAILTLALGTENPLKFFSVVSLATQCVLVVTLVQLYVLRHRLRAVRASRLAYLSVLLLLADTVAVAGLVRFSFEPAVAMPPEQWTGLLVRLVGIVCIAGLLGLAAFQNHWRARQSAVRAKQAELEALQARIRPHFLFNTLNTGAALVHERPEEAERLLLDLADLFRAALAGPREIQLDEELSLVRRYLEIESLRFGERLRVDWQLPREIPPVRVPALSIQPLVENAIRHGVERVQRGGRIEIALTTTREHVVVRISNPLVLADGQPAVGHRVGLNAAQARIEALTGGRGSVQTQVLGEFYVATMRLPRPRPANRGP